MKVLESIVEGFATQTADADATKATDNYSVLSLLKTNEKDGRNADGTPLESDWSPQSLANVLDAYASYAG